MRSTTAWIPILHRSAIIKNYSEFDFLEGYPKVIQWQQALLQTNVLKHSVPGILLDIVDITFENYQINSDLALLERV